MVLTVLIAWITASIGLITGWALRHLSHTVNGHQAHIDQLTALLASERETHQARIDDLLEHVHQIAGQASPDLTELIALVDRLCQRLQAPEQAIVDHQIQQVDLPTPPAVQPDDDQGYWEAMERINTMSKGDLAEHAMSAEIGHHSG